MPWTGHISAYSAILYTIKVIESSSKTCRVLIACQNPTEQEYLDLLRVAEANTWPFISRIRSHCLVEKTLDKCVQRLRETVAAEAEREYQAHLQRYPNSPSRTKDRTPSFYVSRSMANLTGLSVADPAPLHVLQTEGVPKVAALPAQRNSITNGKLDCNHHFLRRLL